MTKETRRAALNENVLRVQHCSLQFSDRNRKAKHDIEQAFTYKGAETYPIKTFTEVGPETDLRGHLVDAVKEFGCRAVFFRSNAVVIDRAIIQPRTWQAGSVFVADTSVVEGPGHDSGFATARFRHVDPTVGRLSVAGSHRPTGWKDNRNRDIQERYAEAEYNWAMEESEGDHLAIGAGDYNMNDITLDWFLGRRLTSMADELGAHQNTGHGPIDGFWSTDRDARVRALWFNVLDDREMFMHSDHWVCRGAWGIRRLDV